VAIALDLATRTVEPVLLPGPVLAGAAIILITVLVAAAGVAPSTQLAFQGASASPAGRSLRPHAARQECSQPA